MSTRTQNKRGGSFSNGKKRNNRDKYVQVSQFLLGGSISDPLNLAGLTNDHKTPICSPAPTPQHIKEEIGVLIPTDLTDPLKLNNDCEIKESSELCHRLLISPTSKLNANINTNQLKRKRTESDSIIDLKDDLKGKRLRLDLKQLKTNLINDHNKIVSPVLPQKCEIRFNHHQTNHHSQHKNQLNSNKRTKDQHKLNVNNSSSSFQKQKSDTHPPQMPNKSLNTLSKLRSHTKSDGKKPFIFKSNQNLFYYANGRKFNLKDQKFQFGNYNRYYGYRNQSNQDNQDLRLTKFKKEWFFNKTVLDIGCNVGYVTCFIACNFNPKKIVGIDIDPELIKSAKKNIRNYLENVDKNLDHHQQLSSKKQFPVSLSICHGPLVEKEVNKEKDENNKKVVVEDSKDENKNEIKEEKEEKELEEDSSNNDKMASTLIKNNYPKNINFVAANYVLLDNELISMQKPEYDCILCLSVTKWVQLNFGDDGVRNLFKRVFLQLKPNGKFVLEPQAFWTYKSKKALTVCISLFLLFLAFLFYC